MKRKEIAFNAEELVASVEEFADYLEGKKKLTLRTRKLKLPQQVDEIKPRDIVALRERLSLSQAVFAKALNVPKVTEISWEKGRRKPTGAALRLLDLVRRNPKILDEIWTEKRELTKAA
jgi:putative transcriptional regulator